MYTLRFPFRFMTDEYGSNYALELPNGFIIDHNLTLQTLNHEFCTKRHRIYKACDENNILTKGKYVLYINGFKSVQEAAEYIEHLELKFTNYLIHRKQPFEASFDRNKIILIENESLWKEHQKYILHADFPAIFETKHQDQIEIYGAEAHMECLESPLELLKYAKTEDHMKKPGKIDIVLELYRTSFFETP